MASVVVDDGLVVTSEGGDRGGGAIAVGVPVAAFRIAAATDVANVFLCCRCR